MKGGAASPAMRLRFCGADRQWAVGAGEIRRRHLFFLHAFAADPQIEQIYVLRRSSRLDGLKRLWSGKRRTLPRARSIAVVRWLPERPWLPATKSWNRALARWWVRRQLGTSALRTVVWCHVLRGMAIAEDLELEGEWYVDTDHDILRDPNRRSLSRFEAEALVLRCARRARRVYSASRNMLDWLRAQGVDHARRLRNGVDPDRLGALAPVTPAASEAPVLGYVGVLSPWIDFELLLDLARRRPEWRFVLAGSWYRMRPLAELAELANVDLMGPVAASEVPSLLGDFHVALGLYRREPWLDVDSMKLYEYLAAGLPTVSTPFHPHLAEDFEGLIHLAGDAAAFEAEIRRILRWPEARRRQQVSRGRDFARRHSWDVRTGEALAAVKSSTFEDTEDGA